MIVEEKNVNLEGEKIVDCGRWKCGSWKRENNVAKLPGDLISHNVRALDDKVFLFSPSVDSYHHIVLYASQDVYPEAVILNIENEL